MSEEREKTRWLRERVWESQRRLEPLYERAEERIKEAEQRLDESRQYHPVESDPASAGDLP
jgi:hypothetical protein